ncbi:MAG TPA: 3-oxoacyl-[acyl-carrier-protein] synthase III C-terminal domain-containing protein [Methylomirabilota bacterium]|nr:3-oxoacyl-[acyl-carrier-protein] synthase III C-terminal domain-containing protein [Methylomirabilota bacterium]
MRIAGTGSAFPPYYHTQDEIAAALKARWARKLKNPEVLDRVLSRVSVDGRHISLPMMEYYGLDTWGKANDAWIRVATELGEKALCRALAQAGVQPAELDAIYFVSVTGISSPSIDARLVNRMGLPARIKRVPIFGLGCVAGAAGISRAADYVRGFPEHAAALLSVELCSLTLQQDDLSMANLISAGLFGDGAAAVIVTGAARDASGPEILATRSSFYNDTEDAMGWGISEKGFHIVLSPAVPQIVLDHLAEDVDAFLGDQGLRRSDIGSWIMHTGGPKVLEATATALDLPREALEVSWESLRKVGNLSSASVLLVLDEYMDRKRPKEGTLSILAAMGPGFCAELLLLRW